MSGNFSLIAIGEIAIPAERAEVPVAGYQYRQLGVQLWGKGAYERETIDGSQTKYNTFSRVEAGDIVVNKIWARNGSAAVVPEKLAGCYVSTEFPTFLPKPDKLIPEWFHWITKTKPFWEQCDEKSRGTSGQNRIHPEKFLEIKIPLPPIEEQRRIVARIEELAAKIEEAQSLRREAHKQAESIVHTSLSLVFESQSRKSGWERKPISEAVEIARGKFAHRPRNEPRFYGGNIPFIQIGDISNSNRYIQHYSQTLNEDGLAISRLFPIGTVVIAITGATIGVTGILDFDSCFPDSIVGLIARQGIASPEFIYWALEYAKRAALAEATQTTQPNINLGNLVKLRIPIPTHEEQCQIVAYLDDLQAKVDSLKKLQAESAAELDALLPSILDKAFKGEL